MVLKTKDQQTLPLLYYRCKAYLLDSRRHIPWDAQPLLLHLCIKAVHIEVKDSLGRLHSVRAHAAKRDRLHKTYYGERNHMMCFFLWIMQGRLEVNR